MENNSGYQTLVAVVKNYFFRLYALVALQIDKDKEDFGVTQALASREALAIDTQFHGRMKALKVAIAQGAVKETVEGTALREIKQGLTKSGVKFMQRNALSRAKSITGTTKERMQAVFADLAKQDADLLQVRQTLQEMFNEVNKSKLDTIAVTEYRTAYHYGQNDALESLDEELTKEGKRVVRTWRSAADGDVRDSHAQMEGEERDIDEAFSNGLMYPCDPAGPPEEVINCRCSIEVKEVED